MGCSGGLEGGRGVGRGHLGPSHLSTGEVSAIVVLGDEVFVADVIIS